MEVRWIPINESLPDCTSWDEDRQAFFSTQVITISPTLGQRITFARMDDIMWPQPRQHHGPAVRTRDRSLKWGVSGHDPSITHWMPLLPTPY